MENITKTINSLLQNPRYADSLAVIKAARNGAVYGAKVRFPHALVILQKSHLILTATRQHARNLALFAAIYKSLMLLLRRTSPTGKESSAHAFLAGLIGGHMVFGRGIQSSVNQQIVVYVFARAVLALAKLAVQGSWAERDDPWVGGGAERRRLDVDVRLASGSGSHSYLRRGAQLNAWPIFASLSWATIMWVFRWHPETIQPSLRSSMKYIYVNADRWDSLRNFLIFNT